jgi:arylformamidase
VTVLYDITPTISPRLAVWPGDTPASRRVLMDLAAGDTVTLSSLEATVHLGAHADAPSHYGLGAPDIAAAQLDRYLGPCQVVRAAVRRGERVTAAHLDGDVDGITEPRVLIVTATFPDPDTWNADFAGLAPELVDQLADRGVRLLGVDTPSVDLSDSKDLPAHRRCLARDVAILEGLVLSAVPVGRYELIALPLKLEAFDASPVRAVLRAIGRAAE